jgi:hypothetical protein
MGIAFFNAECPGREDPGIHAGQDRQLESGRRRQISPIKTPRVRRIGPKNVVYRRHEDLCFTGALKTQKTGGPASH